MAENPLWIIKSTALALHDEQIAEHGGTAGIRDIGLLESALDRPKNLFNYTAAGLPALAASYACGIVKNHPFLDGNKRTSAVVSELFLMLNGFDLAATDAEVVSFWLLLAAGEIEDEQAALWFEARIQKRAAP